MAELNDLLEDALDDLLQSNNESKQEETSKKQEQPSSTANVEEEIREHFERLAPQLQEEMLGGGGSGPGVGGAEGAVPQIFGMMQNLISKELLYPALKDLLPKFEEWLKRDLSAEDRDRYGQQKDLIREMVEIFEDDSLTSQQMFERNLELMEKMQALGSPPQDLTVPDGQNCAII